MKDKQANKWHRITVSANSLSLHVAGMSGYWYAVRGDLLHKLPVSFQNVGLCSFLVANHREGHPKRTSWYLLAYIPTLLIFPKYNPSRIFCTKLRKIWNLYRPYHILFCGIARGFVVVARESCSGLSGIGTTVVLLSVAFSDVKYNHPRTMPLTLTDSSLNCRSKIQPSSQIMLHAK
jgi:hypothetical protein